MEIESGNWRIALNELYPGENVCSDATDYSAIVRTWRGPGDPPSEQALRDAFAGWLANQPGARDKIIARLKQDDEYRALVIAYRDDKGMTNKQVLHLLEAKFSEQV